MRLSFLLIVLACACSVSPDSEGFSDDKNQPIRMAPAKLAASSYLDVFKALCLDAFPDQSKMQQAAKRFGFRSIDAARHLNENDYSGALESKSRNLRAQIGKSTMFWSGPGAGGGAFEFQGCTLRGHVTDPQNLSDELVRTEYESEIVFSEIEGDDDVLKGTLKGSGGTAKATFQLPYLYSVASDSNVIGAERCGSLTSCRVWKEVKFELFLPGEDYPF